ncbi:MAG: hypothetical protein IJ192_10590 [Clostridia bacterium]|nr:hypothetical protein [Clostridia bacterium]
MTKNLLTECPYCHRKISFFGAAILKTKGEHCCAGCKCISNVVINKSIYGVASGACVLSFLILFLYSIYGDHGDIRGVLYVFLPFLIFYILVPFFVKLEPCNDKSAVKKLHRKISPIPLNEKGTSFKMDQPIELNVSEDFSDSFMKAKKSMKINEEEPEEVKDDRIIDEDDHSEDLTSQLDFDITGSMNAPESIITKEKPVEEEYQELPEFNGGEIEESTIPFTEDTPTVNENITKPDEFSGEMPGEENEISFLSGNLLFNDDNTMPEDDINVPDGLGEEVSFILK